MADLIKIKTSTAKNIPFELISLVDNYSPLTGALTAFTAYLYTPGTVAGVDLSALVKGEHTIGGNPMGARWIEFTNAIITVAGIYNLVLGATGAAPKPITIIAESKLISDLNDAPDVTSLIPDKTEAHEVWQMEALDSANPKTVDKTASQITVDAIVIDVDETDPTKEVLTRA
jgi:hypothetical protein